MSRVLTSSVPINWREWSSTPGSRRGYEKKSPDLIPAPGLSSLETTGPWDSSQPDEVPDEVWPGIRDSEPPGLYRGPVVLEDGRQVDGMLGEAGLISDPRVRDITTFGGWRAYLAGRRPKTPGPRTGE